jgi:hypothetical protein
MVSWPCTLTLPRLKCIELHFDNILSPLRAEVNKRTGEVRRWFRWGDTREVDHLEDTGVNGRIILKWVLKKWYWGTWTVLMCFGIGAGGGFS